LARRAISAGRAKAALPKLGFDRAAILAAISWTAETSAVDFGFNMGLVDSRKSRRYGK
jgi:hypothetical protein